MRLRRASAGFILPTVVIASVVLFAVLTVAVSTISGTANSLDSRVYQNMASEAAQSGLKYADSCIDANGIATITWSGGTALYPSVDCAGATSCSSPDCYLSNDGTVRTTFKVTADMSPSNAIVNITSVGTAELLRTDGSVWKSFNISAKYSRSLAVGGNGYVVREISSGDSHTCVLGSDFKVYCWGRNQFGQLGDGTSVDRSTPVAVLTGAIPMGISAQSISLGAYQTCVVGSDSKAYCWGSNGNGQLGDNTTTNRSTPVTVLAGAIPSGVSVRSLSLGSYHTCALGSDSKAYCWGLNTYGQLGDSTTTQRNVPVAVLAGAIPSGVSIRSIGLGNMHTCALGSNSKIYCWGYNTYGQLGDNTTSNRATPVAVLAGAMPSGVSIRSISIGSSHSCVLGSDSKAYCWGFNNFGQLGDNTTSNRATPVAVLAGSMPSGVSIRSISIGVYHGCAIGSDSKAYCWGYNSGALGDNTTTNRSTPVEAQAGSIPSGVNIRSMSLGNGYTCAIGSDSKAYCWGYNGNGQLGDGTITQRLTPVAVQAGAISANSGIRLVSTGNGASHTCALDFDSKAYCWGYNNRGQIGDGTTTNRSTPVAVMAGAIPAGTSVLSISVGDTDTCVIGSDSKAYCWGYNGAGQLGDNTTTDRLVPAAVQAGAIPTGVSIRSISLGTYHTCAVGSDSKAYCWGQNGSYGSIGDGTTTQRNAPVAVQAGAIPSGVSIISLGLENGRTCALGSDSKAYCWGLNSVGQLGDNTTTNRLTPVAVQAGAIPSGVSIRSLSPGLIHTCVIGSDSKVYCWGYNGSGQLGDNTTTNRLTPVAVQAGAIPSGVSVQALSLGNNHTCVLGSDSKAYCWGWDSYGQLGDNMSTNRLTPVAVQSGVIPANVIIRSLSLGESHTCALGSDSKAYCWGYNNYSQLGDNTTTNRLSPIAVSGGGTVPPPTQIGIPQYY